MIPRSIWMPRITHPPPLCWCVKGTPLRRGERLPPHRIVLRVLNVGNFPGNFGEVAGGKPPKAINSPATHVLEAEAAIKSPLQAPHVIYYHGGSSSVNDHLVTLCSSWLVLGWARRFAVRYSPGWFVVKKPC